MAKRTRKQKERALVRRPAPPTGRPITGVVADASDAATPEVPTPTATPLTGPDGGVRRRVERVGAVRATPLTVAAVTGARPRPQRHQPTGFIEPLESEDPAIPFNRVPYVPADLRRVAIIAAIMITLIIIADIVVNNVVR